MRCLIKTLFIALFVNAYLTFAQSFSYIGPTGTVTIPFGQTQYQATYYFTYYNIQNLFMPKMLIFLDGNLLTQGMCAGAEPFTPLEYTLNFAPGNHTVVFRLMSLTGVSNCINAPLHHEEQFSIYCNFKVRMKNIFDYGTISVDNINRNSPYDRPSDVNN